MNKTKHTVFQNLQKKIICKLYGGLYLCFLSSVTLANNNLYTFQFKPISISRNLPSKEVRHLYQDKEGYIWIPTYNGLVRYDGYSAITYQSNGLNGQHPLDNYVNMVAEDNENNLWIGAHDGLYVLNKRTDEIKRIESTAIQGNNIGGLVCSRNGDIWVGARNGLFCRKAGNTTFDLILNISPTWMIEDRKGHIWIGSGGNGLHRYDPYEARFYSYPKMNPANSAHYIFQDEDDHIWVGTWRYGLVKLKNAYDLENCSYQTFVHREENEQSLLDNIIYCIAQDRDTKKIWIGSRSGLSIMESEENEGAFTNFVPGDQAYNLPFNEVNSLLYTNDGLMWLGMLGGGVCTIHTRKTSIGYDPLQSLHKYYPTSSVRSVFQDNNGKIWMGITGFGLVCYDREKQLMVPYKEHPALKHLNYTSTVNDIIDRKKTGELCFATYDDGIWFYNEKSGKVNVLNSYAKLPDILINSLLDDSKGNLWIGTRTGLYVLSPDDQLCSLDELMSSPDSLLQRTPISKIIADNSGYIWVVTDNNGIWRIDVSEKPFKIRLYHPSENNLSTTQIASICMDGYHRLWVGTTANGLKLFNKEKDCFESVLSDFFSNEGMVSNILEDDKHTLWVTSNSGLFHIDMPENGKGANVHIYTANDGLQGDGFSRNACFKGLGGELFFGGYQGLNYFFPDKIYQDTLTSPVVITDIKIHNTSLRNLPSEQQDKIAGNVAVDYVRDIVLSYLENNFSIDFAILNYISPDINRYAYWLKGYDKDWISTNAERHFAYYNNLPAGTYTFYVKGASPNGIWSSEIKSLQITILPAPWVSWWAYCIYMLLVMLITWVVIRIIRNRIQMKHAINIAKIERQKIEEINHAKLQFFTDITHELLTPLSIISASVDELKQEHPTNSRVYNVIHENTARLIRLIQQILEFRKVENRKLQLKVSPGNISRFLQKSVLAFTPLVKRKKLSFCFDMSEEYSGYFDVDKLDKIMYNLLSNAAKYSLEGGTITVTQTYDTDTGIYTFAINNTGELIPNEKLKHLFERFYEGEYRKFHTIGTGIGLSLTRDLVLAHHGTIQAFSSKEQGNTFVVDIPVTRPAFKAEEIDEEIDNTDYDIPSIEEDIQEEEVITEETKLGLPLILLVEDNEDLLTLMLRLAKRKYNVVTAQNGREALEVIEKKDVDIIVSDIMMPEMDGVELCHHVKTTFETCHIPLILLTAKTSDEDRITGYESGADGYISKPVRLSVLFAKIDNLLKKQKRLGVDFRKQLVFEAKDLNYTSMDEKFIQKAVDCVNAHLDDIHFEHAQFMTEMGMARTTLADKLKLLTGLTPSGFINNVRLQAAIRLIDDKKKIRMSDLAYAVGFNDPKYFSSCFKKKFGMTPTEYMEKYDN